MTRAGAAGTLLWVFGWAVAQGCGDEVPQQRGGAIDADAKQPDVQAPEVVASDATGPDGTDLDVAAPDAISDANATAPDTGGPSEDEALYWFGTDVPILPTGPAPSRSHFCAGGGAFDAKAGIRGWACLAPAPVTGPSAKGPGILWLPGPIYHVVP